MGNVKNEFEEFEKLVAPKDLPKALDFELTESLAAGTISCFLENGSLNAEKKGVLEACVQYFEKNKDKLSISSRKYFEKLIAICKDVLKNQ